MKYILTIIFALYSLVCVAQKPEQYIGNANNRVVAKGELKADSLLIAAIRDTTGPSVASGGIVFRPGSMRLNYYNGQWWRQIMDKLYIDSLHNAGINPSDTAAMLAPYIRQNGNLFGDSMRIGTRDNFPIVLSANQVKKAILTPAGRLGIGTMNPATTLDVNDSTGNATAQVYGLNASLAITGYAGVSQLLFVGAAGASIRTTATNFTMVQPSIMPVVGSYNWVTWDNPHHAQTTGAGVGMRSLQSFSPTSGNASFSNFAILGTVNQTGGANGISRGLHISQTITSAADYRSLQIDAGPILINKNVFETISPTGTTMAVVLDTTTGFLKRVFMSSFSAPLNRYSIGVGNSLNAMASSDAKYIDSIKAIQARKFMASNYIVSGDSAQSKPRPDTVLLYGDSEFFGFLQPFSTKASTQIANGLNRYEWNRAISGTRMAPLAPTDSSMFNRLYTVPNYRATISYIFLEYGANDALTGSDTATYRLVYNNVLDTLIINRGYPLNRIVVVGSPFFRNSNPTTDAKSAQYAFVSKDVATKKGVKFVDVYATQVLNGGLNTTVSDSLHWNELGAQVIAAATLDSLASKSGSIRSNGILSSRGLLVKNGYNFPTILTAVDTADREYFAIRGFMTTPNSQSIGIGAYSLDSLPGVRNTGVGTFTLSSNTTGQANFAGGHSALFSNQDGSFNIAIGQDAMALNVSGNQSVAIGVEAGYSGTNASGNVWAGYRAGNGNLGGGTNVGIGFRTLESGNANNNVAVGALSLRNASLTGANCVAIGVTVLENNTSGGRNIGIGPEALRRITTGGNNIGIGYQAFDSATTGGTNIGLGFQAGHNMQTGSTGNLFLGNLSGRFMRSGNNNVIIGSWAGTNGANNTRSNHLIVVDGTGTSVPWIWGDSLQRVNIGGGTSPTQKLHVSGQVRIDTITTGTTSDSLLTVSAGVIRKIDNPLGNVVAGSYTPTLTNVTNISSSSAGVWHYLRIGNEVSVSGRITMDPISIGSIEVGFSLPFASTFSTDSQLGGACNTGAISGQNGVCNPDQVNSRGRVAMVANDTNNHPYYVTFQYTITPP